MKSIWFTLAIASVAITGSARADTWGRGIPNTLISRYQDKADAVQKSPVDAGAIQAPPAASTTHYQDGYPFTDRCSAGNAGCCSNIWDGYASSCGCGFGHGFLNHCRRACGGCALGGCVNSFAGGACCDPCGRSGLLRLGWLHSGRLSAWSSCECRGHRLGAFRRPGCFTCDTGCDAGSCTGSVGCSQCGGHSHHGDVHHSPIQKHDAGQQLQPPAPPAEPTPAADPAAAAPAEKSAFLPRTYGSRQYRSGF